MLPDLHIGFSRGRSGGLIFPSLSEFSTVYCDPHNQRLGIVNKREIDVFLELPCFFHDPADIGNLISGSSAFSKFSLNIRKFTVHILLKRGLENSLTPQCHQWTNYQNRINKETQTLNETLDQMDLIDTFRTLHPNAEEYTFFSSAHGIFSRIDHTLGHKSSLSKFKKIEIVPSIFSDHNAMRLDINYRKKKTAKIHNLMEIKQYIAK